MSYVSLLKNIPEFLSQPTGIAAIASVGIHGAIALIVPLMPVDSNQPKQSSTQKTVGVLELSQADLSRLPQTPDTNPVALQPQQPLFQSQFPQQPQLNNPPNLNTPTTVLPPLPPPLNTPSSLPPITTIPDNYRIAALPQSQPLRVQRKRDFRFTDPGFNAGDKKFNPVTPPGYDNREVIPEKSQPLPVDKLPDLNAAQPPNNLPATPSATTPDSNNTNPATTQPSNDKDRIAPIAKTPEVGDDLTIANQSIPKWEQGSTPSLPDLPAKQAQQGQISLVNSYENLRKSLQQQYPNSQEKAVIRGTVPTEKPGIGTTVLGVLVVNPEDQVEVYFQDRSISPELRKQVIAYFNKNAPKGEKQVNRYPFSLRFQYNSNNNTAEPNQEKTPAVVIPNSGNNSETNNNQPTPKPEATSRTLPKLEVNTTQPTPTPTTTTQPSAEQTVKKDDLSSSLKSSQQLIRQLQNLRESREKQQNANP